MEKNEERIGLVEKLGSNGEGIIRDDGYTVFVPYVLPQEKIRYRVLKVKDKIAFGKVTEICAPAEERVRPKCKVYEKCGGCQLQHLKYKLQLKLKSKIVKDCFSKIAFINVSVPLAMRSDLEYGYRNKLQLPVREDSFGFSVGFFAQNSHRVIPIDNCPIQPEWCTRVITSVKNYLRQNNISVYSDRTGTGLVKHVVVRDVDGKLLITLVINGDSLPDANALVDELRSNIKEFSLFINVNKNKDNVIFGEKFVCLCGREKVITSDLGVKFEIGPGSFMQVNDSVRRKIYQDALKFAETDKETVVIDAYSGAGMLTAIFAQKAKRVIGIEILREAVDCADDLKELNGLDGVMENVCARCEDVLPDIIARERKGSERLLLVLDPPRQGVEESVIEAIAKSLPDEIIYISCSPQTLARDVGLLTGTLKRTENGIIKNPDAAENRLYEISVIQPYDMFPQTKHVETLVCLRRTAQ